MPTIETIKLRRPGENNVTVLKGPVASCDVYWSDGTVTPHVSTAEQTPSPQPSPGIPGTTPSIPAPRPTPTEILATPGNWATALKAFRDGRQLLLQCGGVFPIRAAIQVPFDGVKIGSYGAGDPPVLFDADEPDGEQMRCAIGIGGSAEDVEITGLCFDSPDARTGRFGAIWSSGRRVHIHDCTIKRVFDFVNITSTSATVHVIEHNVMLVRGGVGQYFVYAKGRGHVVRGNKINNAQVAFVRCNLFQDLTIEDNDVIGVAGSDMMPSRITIGKGRGYAIRGNRVKDAIVGAGPLSNCDGFRDEGYDPVRMAAARTEDGIIDANVFDGPGCRITIGDRVVNLKVRNNLGAKIDGPHGDKTIVCERPDGTMIKITLPGAKDVAIQ
jgi:hypothetical protein